ncbi:putative ankyrin repeat protein RF_0381 [Mytilus edulis]|uniref:putative ankyrin repeat protein RF_0381 n=1 Tax=Mytilus edulis TaxID=6550 RepID=UPI0039EED89C
MACLHLLLQSEESVFIGGLIQEYMDIKSSSGMTPLSIAYDNRHKEMLKILILKGADIDKRYGPQKETLVFKACKDRENDILLILLENKARTNVFNIDRKTPLYISCFLGYDEITCLLLEKNANVNLTSYEGYSPLYFSCIHNNIAEAEMLLKKDANPNVINETGESLLIMSCKQKHVEMLDLLLQHNADVNYCHYMGETALYFAFKIGSIDIMRRLLNYHAHWNVCSHERDFFLHRACVKGQYDIMNIILEYNTEIDINKVIFNDETLLHTSLKNGHIEIGKLLLQRGADINVNASFHQVCLNGQLSDVVDILSITTIEQRAVENEFIWACGESKVSLVKLLINSCFKDTPMKVLYEGWFLAAEWSTSTCLHFLHRLGIDINKQRSNDGHAAIHIACNAGNFDVVTYLLNCDHINLESQATFSKITPLLIAITNGNDKIVRLLIESNANVNALSAYGENALLLACSSSHENVLSVLLELKTFDILKQFEEKRHHIINEFYMPMKSVLKEMLCYFQAGYAVNDVDSVMHFACRMQDEELLDKLITSEGNVDSLNAFGETPLLIAVSNQNVNTIHKLLDANASINLASDVYGQGVQNLLGKTSIKRLENILPVHLACLLNNEDIVSVLLNRNADCSIRLKCVHNSSNPELQYEEFSPVYISVLSNNNSMLNMLLNNSLHPVCFMEVSVFCNTLIEKNHFTYDDDTKYQIKLNLTPFQVALILGFTKLVNTFLCNGLVDVNGKFTVTSSVLSSVSGNHSSIIEVVKKYNIQDDDCQTEVTPLLYSTLTNNCELINILLENHAVVTDTANISLLDIIAINSEITSLILTWRATFPLVSRCLVNAPSVALLVNNNDTLASLSSECFDFTESIDITIIHFICFRGYTDHLRIILEYNINVINTFTMPIIHLFCSSTYLVENMEADEFKYTLLQ